MTIEAALSDLCRSCLECDEYVPADLMCDLCGKWWCSACVLPGEHECEEE